MRRAVELLDACHRAAQHHESLPNCCDDTWKLPMPTPPYSMRLTDLRAASPGCTQVLRRQGLLGRALVPRSKRGIEARAGPGNLARLSCLPAFERRCVRARTFGRDGSAIKQIALCRVAWIQLRSGNHMDLRVMGTIRVYGAVLANVTNIVVSKNKIIGCAFFVGGYR